MRNAQLKRKKQDDKLVDLTKKDNIKKIRLALLKEWVVDEEKYDAWILDVDFDSFFWIATEHNTFMLNFYIYIYILNSYINY